MKADLELSFVDNASAPCSERFANEYERRCRRLSRKEEVVLYNAAKSGCKKSKDELLLGTMWVLYWKAKRLLPRAASLTMDDLMHDGVIGLLRSFESWNPDGAGSFATYAGFLAEKIMLRAIYNDRPIKLSSNTLEGIWKVRTVTQSLNRQGIENPTDTQLSEATQYSVAKIERLRQRSILDNVASLDSPFAYDDDGSRTVGDSVADFTPSPEAQIEQSEFRQQLLALMEACLPTSLHFRVFTLGFGFEDGEAHKPASIGQILGLPMKEVYKLEKLVTRKVTSAKTKERLLDLLAVQTQRKQ